MSLQWSLWYQDADGPSSANLGIQDICHENHTVRCWVSVKMFKDQNTEIGAWISLNLRITLFSPELSMSSPRMSTFPTWQFSRIRVKKTVNPVYIPCISWSPRFMWCCVIKSVSGSYLRNYALGGRSNGVHSVNRHAIKVLICDHKEDTPKHCAWKKNQDLWWPHRS